MQYNIKNILQSGEKIAVHVPTEDEAREVVKLMWYDWNHNFRQWSKHSTNTCIAYSGFEDAAFYKSEGYTIIAASIFIEHNTPKVEKKRFAVKADSFELYKRFVKDCEGMGWKENKIQNRGVYTFDCDILENDRHVWFFGPKLLWNVCDRDVLTDGSIVYALETQYPEAIAAAKAWFEEDEVKVAPTNAELSESVKLWKRLHDDAKKENLQLKEAIKNSSNKAVDLETQVKLLFKHNKDQHDRNNAKFMAVSILLSSFPLQATHRQKQFAVDCIKQHIDELIEKEYDEPGALPF